MNASDRKPDNEIKQTSGQGKRGEMPGDQASHIPSPINPDADGQRDLLSIEELSAKSGFSISTLRRRVKDGTLPVIQPGGYRTRMAFQPDALERRPEPPSPPGDANTNPSGHDASIISGPRPQWMKNLKNT